MYADPDRDALHVRLADEAYALGGDTAGRHVPAIDKLIDAARQAGADAVHPGYGFLSENADFAQAVLDAGLTWIGPPPQAIRDLGDKVTARHIAERAGAPLVPGTPDPVAGPDEVVAFAEQHGLPVAIKAAFGGGGRGLKVARTMEEIPELFAAPCARRSRAFGRGECFVERYLDKPRHVEAQVLADQHGNVIVVGTRDCSLQRRHQKLVEEAPAPFLTDAQRDADPRPRQGDLPRGRYHGAGTVEYLVGADGTVSFLEVNTRLQVEHPVTEETTGIDLVREQFRIADGEKLRFTEDPEPRGHAIEFRINGEDPGRNFLPAPGTVTRYVEPGGPGVRVDSGIEPARSSAAAFDSLLAKVIVTGRVARRGAGAVPAGAGRDGRRRHGHRAAVPPGRRPRSGLHRRAVHACTPAGSRPSSSTTSRRSPRRPTSPTTPAARETVVVEVGGKRLEVSLPAGFGGRRRRFGEEGARRSARPGARRALPRRGDSLTARCRAPSSRSRWPTATPSRPATWSWCSRR